MSLSSDGLTVARATDPAEAEELVGNVYLPNRLDFPRKISSVDMALVALQLGTLTVGRLSFGRNLRLLTEEPSNFHVNTPLAGRALSTTGSSGPLVTGPGQAAVFSPERLAEIRLTADAVQMCLMVPRASVESELEELIGRSITRPLRFDFDMDLSTPIGRSWLDAVNVVSREFDHGAGLATHPLAGRHLERLLIDGLLLGQPHNYSEALMSPAKPVPPGAIAKAVQLLEELPGEPWSSLTLAREVHVSVRSLQEGFKREVGKPPMAYLRDVRLRGVRHALRAAVPSGTTVEATASQWGFVHMGRFAAVYRASFGESPSTTLGRLDPPGDKGPRGRLGG
jgi:AraC-like DNA-binding protein